MNENAPIEATSEKQIKAIAATPAEETEWKGYTLEQLRMKRAMALVRREVGRERLDMAFGNMKTRVNDNGIRGLLFDNKTIGHLKTADYMLLGWNLSQTLVKLWARSRK